MSAELRVQSAELTLERKSRETYSVSLGCVGYELSSRAVASQVFSPLQRLTSVFGMGTGGPTALKTLTQVLGPRFWLGTRTLFPIGSCLWITL